MKRKHMKGIKPWQATRCGAGTFARGFGYGKPILVDTWQDVTCLRCKKLREES